MKKLLTLTAIMFFTVIGLITVELETDDGLGKPIDDLLWFIVTMAEDQQPVLTNQIMHPK